MSVLSQRMDNDMVIRGLADKTRTAYIGAVRELAKHFHRSPDKISDKEVQAYLLYLSDVNYLVRSATHS